MQEVDDQIRRRADDDQPDGSRDALAGQRETFDGDRRRHEGHRAKVHHPEDQ